MPSKVCLLTIDPQIDFCEGGALPVTGATKDLERLAKMVDKYGGDIDDIQITMDSHYHMHIAQPGFWQSSAGAHPAPFTAISEDDVATGKWRPVSSDWKDWALQYTQQLKQNGRYMLVIWPDHCIIGSRGHALQPTFFDAVTRWEHKFSAIAPRTTKGSNPFTEHFSAVKADVPRADDEGTRLNGRFVKTLQQYDAILISGEALSHCVNFTISDVAEEFSPDQVKKFILLEDASSSVTGFEKQGREFIDRMVAKGVTLSKTDTYFK
jgi:nicotinamidase-related amidase